MGGVGAPGTGRPGFCGRMAGGLEREAPGREGHHLQGRGVGGHGPNRFGKGRGRGSGGWSEPGKKWL